jgi:hypothetical protein
MEPHAFPHEGTWGRSEFQESGRGVGSVSSFDLGPA